MVELGHAAAGEFQPLGGVAVVAREHLGRDQGPRGAEDRLGRRPERALRLRCLPGRAGAGRAAAGQGRARATGDVDGALATAHGEFEAEYYIPHMAHAPMEPPAATGRIVDGRCEVWAPTQAPQAAREGVAKHLGLPLDHVTVNVTLLGGGFGRKSKPDYVVEAALLSRGDGRQAGEGHLDARGRPAARLSTTRSRSSAWKPALDADGKPVAWLHRSVRRRSRRPSAPTRSTSSRSRWAWAWSTCRSSSRTCASRTRSGRRTPASAGTGRSRTSRMRSRSSPSSPSWPRRRGATRRTICWS